MIMRAPVLLALRVLGLFGFSLALVLPPNAWAETSAASAEFTPRVLVLGDSISAAYGMSLEQGWVALLESRLREHWSDARVINASISGDTSAGGLRRLPALLEDYRPDLLVVELGGNDGLRGYPTNKLQANLVQMTELAQGAGARVIILPMEIPPNYGPRYTRAFREAFVQAAEPEPVTLGPFVLDGIATEPSLMQSDGIHPTVEAQVRISNMLYPLIKAELLKQDNP
jgi:acyl-CoA thioesterase-1